MIAPSTIRVVLSLLAVTLMLAVAHVTAVPVLADHCGADASVTPTMGAIGTTFRIDPQLGGETRVRLYVGSTLVSNLLLEGEEPVLRFAPKRVGVWTARAFLVSAPDCASSVSFRVTPAPPDTDTVRTRGSSAPFGEVMLVAEAGVALAAAFVIRARHRSARPFLPRS